MVRLAYAKGCLTHKSTTRLQDWALLYALSMERRQFREDEENRQKATTFLLKPDRFREVFFTEDQEGEQETPVMDLSVAEQYLLDLDKPRVATLQGPEDGWL